MIAALFLAAALVGPPSPDVQPVPTVRGYDSQQAHRDAWVACGATAFDLGTTELVIAQGGHEGNVLVKNRAVRVGIGTLGCAGLHYMASRDPGRAKWWSRGATLIRGLAVGWNVSQAIR